jgi:NAD(P)H-hydrate epimerase
MMGTGLKGNLEGLFFEVVELINRQECLHVVALDIPSGVSGDTGVIQGAAILAHLTVSFGFPKMGHFLPPGATRRGRLVNIDLPLPPHFRAQGDQFLLLPAPMRELLQRRDLYGHKNSFGHTLLVGGSLGRLGAIVMSAQSAHQVGTGLVTVATWTDNFPFLVNKVPLETMTVPLILEGPELEAYKRNLPGYTSIVVGPGLGLRADGKRVLEEIFANYQGPMVLDADALNLIAEHRLHDRLVQRRAPTVITPHPGEMARLLGVSKEVVMKDPLKAVRDAVQKTHAIVVLKGAATLIASADEKVFLNHYPNDGMAKAGSGDVLAGMIGGLLGQGMDPFQAAKLGVYLHSLAGDCAARKLGHRSMTAQSIIESISFAFQEIQKPANEEIGHAGRSVLL